MRTKTRPIKVPALSPIERVVLVALGYYMRGDEDADPRTLCVHLNSVLEDIGPDAGAYVDEDLVLEHYKKARS